ncbi:MAG: hypothetical protein AAF468_16895 [Pseudomonadota bacterium]
MTVMIAHHLLEASDHPLRLSFLKWQCRVRQIAMRKNEGKPNDAMMPGVTLAGDNQPLGHIITVLSKRALFSKTPELRHMVQRTNDPAQRRERALQLFSETYFQKADEFDDCLTATFAPTSQGAGRILEKENVTLTYQGFGQQYDVVARAYRLSPAHPLFDATRWHNLLFNPDFHPETIILAFEPDWQSSTSEPLTGTMEK